MGTCKGNRGNLLQHWVLCELLAAVQKSVGNDRWLHYVDANSMAPFSQTEPGYQSTRRQFDNARQGLPGQGASYENAWHRLAPVQGLPYPSSAVFVADAWKSRLSMCLCEISGPIADEIRAWLLLPGCARFSPQSAVLNRSWREGFEWKEADVYFVQFDPYFYDPNRANYLADGARTYPQDLELLATWLSNTPKPIAIQLTSYSSMRVAGSDPVADVDASATAVLARFGFQRECAVIAQGDMVSLVFCRGFTGDLGLGGADQAFHRWLGRIPTG